MVGAAAAAGAPGQSSYFIARVKFVLLDDSDLPKFNRLGGWKAIGSIECLPFINFNDPKTEPIIARPLRSNYTQYPLVNEAVLVKILISKEAQDNVGNYKPEFYYTDIISVWNAPEHNSVPDKSYFLLNPNDKTGTGKFVQTGETKRLVKAPGDVTLEGRRGGSIRLGSNTPGFRTPWTAATSKPIFVISNNPVKAEGPARFEDINKDGSIMMMMSGHNPGFVPASANFDSYDTIATINEKQNVIVTDQKPQSEPTASLVQQDAKPIPADVPVTGSIPVSNPVPPAVKNDTQLDEEELPEREDLEEIDVQVEDVPVYSLGTAQAANVTYKFKTDNSPLGTYSEKSFKSQGKTIKQIIDAYIAKNNEFLKGVVALSIKYSIPNYYDILRVMEKETIGNFEKAALRVNGSVAAAGLIQFTKVTLPLLKKFGITSLDQIITKSAVQQLQYVEAYFEANKSRLTGADIYAIYGTVFYPYIVGGGKISKSDDFILGSERSNSWARKVGAQNPGINGGNPITVRVFKKYVDSLFK
jgi:hypothetical protein